MIGLSCSDYAGVEEACGVYDDGDFDSMAMCCTCGGGSTGGGLVKILNLNTAKTKCTPVFDNQRVEIPARHLEVRWTGR